MADDAILSLDTLIDRPRVAIDGALYEIVSPEELPLLTSQRLAAKGRELDRLMKMDELKPVHEKRLSELLGELTAIIMEPVPAKVRDALTEAQQHSVIEVFTMLSLARKAKLAGAMMRGAAGSKPATAATGGEQAATGESSSPGSSASTAADLPTG